MKSLLAKIISVLTIFTLCLSLCACGDKPLNEENCDNGHNLVQQSYTAPTCRTGGQRISKCSRCDYTETETLLPIDHNYQTMAITPSTCSTHGSQTVKCSMCYNEVTSELPLLNHSYELISETPSTCTIKGVKNYKCKDCQDTYSQEQELLRHNYKTVNTTTCFTDGELKNICNDCQHEEVIEDKPMLTHVFGEDGYCIKCGIYKTLIDINDLNTEYKKYSTSAGTTGAMISTPHFRVSGNLTPKFKDNNSIPYTYFEKKQISMTLYLFDSENEELQKTTALSTINYYQGNSQYTMTLQYGMFINGLANQFLIDVGGKNLNDIASFKLEISCDSYEKIEKTYQIGK